MPTSFIDTHTHLFLPEFDNDREQVIALALTKGVNAMLLPNIDVDSIKPLLSLCEEFPTHCFPAIGLHPTHVKENWDKDIETLLAIMSTNKFYAIGEIGMDLYWDKSTKKIQENAFLKQVEIAIELQLPICIHSRNAVSEIIDLLKKNTNPLLTGVFHCFGGSVEEAKSVIEMGFKIGIGGVVTFKNSGLDDIIKQISLEHILLETDSPYLAPVPFRGKRNESAYLPLIAEKIAAIKGCQIADVAGITSNNAIELFQLPIKKNIL